MMGLLRLVAIGTFGEGRPDQMIVGAPVAGASFGMSPLWIGHANSSIRSRRLARGFYGVFFVMAIAF
jgi:hypothetical protein